MTIKNLLGAIRAKCLNCCCDDDTEVRLCTCKNCPLYPYRFGNNTGRKNAENTIYPYNNTTE